MTAKTLIIGSGPCANNVATELLASGIEICIAAQAKSAQWSLPLSGGKAEYQTEILSEASVLSCRGSVGNFIISMLSAGQVIQRTAANIIIAEENRRQPNLSLYNLVPSPSVLSLSEVTQLLGKATRQEDKTSRDPDYRFSHRAGQGKQYRHYGGNNAVLPSITTKR